MLFKKNKVCFDLFKIKRVMKNIDLSSIKSPENREQAKKMYDYIMQSIDIIKNLDKILISNKNKEQSKKMSKYLFSLNKAFQSFVFFLSQVRFFEGAEPQNNESPETVETSSKEDQSDCCGEDVCEHKGGCESAHQEGSSSDDSQQV